MCVPVHWLRVRIPATARPHKGDAGYWSPRHCHRDGGRAAWSHEPPYATVPDIAGYLALCPNRVEAIEKGCCGLRAGSGRVAGIAMRVLRAAADGRFGRVCRTRIAAHRGSRDHAFPVIDRGSLPREIPAFSGSITLLSSVREPLPPHDVQPPISSALLAVWALFLGLALVLAAHGLQSTLVGLRATLEGFPAAAIGVVMTGFYIGYMVGARVAPALLQSVGHVRMFGAMASLAGFTSLLHAMFVDPYTWVAARFLTGICVAGLTIVIESWLNDRATNEMRGRVLGAYVVVSYASVMAGNLMLNAAAPETWLLFGACAMLFSVAVIPVLLSASPTPRFNAPARMPIGRLWRTSPLGVAGVFVTGMSNGAFFGMGAVFAREMGLTVEATSLFMSALVLGGVVMQWPLAWCSDRMDRRWVLAGMTLGAAAFAATGLLLSPDNRVALYLVSFLIGCLSLPMYSLANAHTNDFVRSEEMVSAGAGLVFANGAGSVFGPLCASVLMGLLGPHGLFWYLIVVHVALGVFAFWRMTRRATVAVQDHVPTVPLPASASPVAAGQAAEAAADAARAHEHVQEAGGVERAEPERRG